MPDTLDAYIFVNGLTRSQANQLRRLVDNNYRLRVGLDAEDRGDGDPGNTPADIAAGDARMLHIRQRGGAVVRCVLLLAGVHDAVVIVTAKDFDALQALLLEDIRAIVSQTETAVALYPPPPQNAPLPGGEMPTTNTMTPGGMYGASWHPISNYRAFVHGFIEPGSVPANVLQSFRTVMGAGFAGASYVTGGTNFVGVVGAPDMATLTGYLNNLPQVQGIAAGTFVSLNVTRTSV